MKVLFLHMFITYVRLHKYLLWEYIRKCELNDEDEEEGKQRTVSKWRDSISDAHIIIIVI